MTHGDRFTYVDPNQKQTLEDIQDAIAVATGDLGLLPGVAFQARVAQLAQLNAAHQTVSVEPSLLLSQPLTSFIQFWGASFLEFYINMATRQQAIDSFLLHQFLLSIDSAEHNFNELLCHGEVWVIKDMCYKQIFIKAIFH